MVDSIPFLKVFVSSPGDVGIERQIVLDVIEKLPYKPAFRDKVAFRVVAWDKPGGGTSMRLNMKPQEAINRGLPRPSECDIVVVIFWSRMGTPFTHIDGIEYKSGTHWELLDAVSSERSRDQTLLYRRTEEKQFKYDEMDEIEQYKKVIDFFKSDFFVDDAGRITRGVNQYDNPESFRLLFETHFEDLVIELLNNS